MPADLTQRLAVFFTGVKSAYPPPTQVAEFTANTLSTHLMKRTAQGSELA
jgi:hypothetical protein